MSHGEMLKRVIDDQQVKDSNLCHKNAEHLRSSPFRLWAIFCKPNSIDYSVCTAGSSEPR
jgi:hypothetical protein